MEKLELPKVEIHMADGIFIKQMLCEKAGTFIEQHVHAYDHTLMIAKGSFRVWRGEPHLGDFKAPAGLLIEAGTKHMLQALEPGSLAYCIHNISRTGEVEVVPTESVLALAMKAGA